MILKAKPTPDQYALFNPESDWVPPEHLPDLANEVEVAIDTETRDPMLAKDRGPGFHEYERHNLRTGFISGISVAWRAYAIYIPLRHDLTQCFDHDLVGRWLKALARQDHTRFIFHNFQYDWGWLEAVFNVPPPINLDDTGAMASLLNENLSSFTLDDLCQWQGLPGKDERLLLEAAAARGIVPRDLKKEMWRLEGKYVGPYAEQDAASTLALAQILRPQLEAENLTTAYGIEQALFPVTLKMKQRGIRVDRSKAAQIAEKMKAQTEEEAQRVGQALNLKVTIKEIRSNRWLKDRFEELGLQYPHTAPSEQFTEGQASFEKNFMANHPHWFPRAAHKIKHQYDLADRFLQKFICEYAFKGRVYPTINQFRSEGGGARSHRVSYSDPPLQQIPSRDDEWAPLIRSCFLPEEGELWAAPDYNQQEYRLIVHVAELCESRGSFAAGERYRNDPKTDFHDYVVEITKLVRRRAKDVNFAKAFGAGVPKFALMIGVALEEAQELYDVYDKELPFVRETAEKYMRFAADNGYIKMIDGARGHFNLFEPAYRNRTKEKEFKILHPEVKLGPCFQEEAEWRRNNPSHLWYMERLKRAFTHKGFNRCIQGSAARQMKKAMVDCYQAGYLPLIQMHDELGFSFNNEKNGLAVQEYMVHAYKLTVPVLVDIEWGVSWGEAAKNKQTGYMATYAEATASKK
jgi:DNA polymerase I-like protein with 3'-5' exonuclease and polymerase domains